MEQKKKSQDQQIAIDKKSYPMIERWRLKKQQPYSF